MPSGVERHDEKVANWPARARHLLGVWTAERTRPLPLRDTSARACRGRSSATESENSMNVIDTLRQAHQELRRAVPSARRKAAKDEGRLSASFREAMLLWDQQKASGVPLADRLKGLDGLLRQVWPFTREWKFLCEQCNDYGLIMADCPGDATCGRSRPHLPHDYGRPCWCAKGRAFQPKPQRNPDDFTQAGRSKPTRVGR